MRHNPGYGIMRQLVCERRIVVVVGLEEFGWRHGDPVAQWLVIGLRAVVAQVCADMGEEGIEAVFASFGLKRGNQRLGMVEFGEAVALVGIENGIGLKHAPVLGVRFAYGVLDLLGVALVKDGDGGFFALAHLCAQFFGLIVGHPERRGVTAHVGNHPEPEYIHAAIRDAARPQWARDWHTAPWLDPRLSAGLEAGDDFLGDSGSRRQSAALSLAIGHVGSPEMA